MEQQLKGQATPEQIADWKTKYGEIFAVKVGGHIAYLKKPDRKILSYASTIGKTDPMKFNEVLLTNCFIGGSEAVKSEDKLFLGVSAKLEKIIEIEAAELEKL